MIWKMLIELLSSMIKIFYIFKEFQILTKDANSTLNFKVLQVKNHEVLVQK